MTSEELADLPEIPHVMMALWREVDDPVYIWDHTGKAWTVARVKGLRVKMRVPRQDLI